MLDFELGEEVGVASHEGDVVGVELGAIAPLEAEGDEGSDLAQDEAAEVGEGAVGHWLPVYVLQNVADADGTLPVCRAALDYCFDHDSRCVAVKCGEKETDPSLIWERTRKIQIWFKGTYTKQRQSGWIV